MKKALDWIKRTFTDDSGEPSSKRQMAFLAFALFVYAVVVDKNPDVLYPIFYLIAALLGISGAEKFRKNK